MYLRRTLRAKLAKLPLIAVAGPWARCVAHEYLEGPPPGAPSSSGPDPLWPGGAKRHGARFTPKGGFDTAYVTETVDTALLEVDAVFRGKRGLVPTGRNPQVLVSIEGTVLNVLDTTDAMIQAQLGTSAGELMGAWAYVPGGGLAPTQLLGQVAFHSNRIHGILYTSAKNPPQTCLCVFPDRLDARREALRVLDGSGTIVSRLP